MKLTLVVDDEFEEFLLGTLSLEFSEYSSGPQTIRPWVDLPVLMDCCRELLDGTTRTARFYSTASSFDLSLRWLKGGRFALNDHVGDSRQLAGTVVDSLPPLPKGSMFGRSSAIEDEFRASLAALLKAAYPNEFLTDWEYSNDVQGWIDHARTCGCFSASNYRYWAISAEARHKSEGGDWLRAAIELLLESAARFQDDEVNPWQKYVNGIIEYDWDLTPVVNWLHSSLDALDPNCFPSNDPPSLERAKFERPIKHRLLVLERLASIRDLQEFEHWLGVQEHLM